MNATLSKHRLTAQRALKACAKPNKPKRTKLERLFLSLLFASVLFSGLALVFHATPVVGYLASL